MLRKILDRTQKVKDVPFIADKGYDAIDIIRKVTELGFVPAIKVKESYRMSVRDPLFYSLSFRLA